MGRARINPLMPPAEIRRLLSYDPETGIFTWKVKRRGRPYGWMPAGTVAGSIYSDGYRLITINGERYKASRLAFVLMYGRWPREEVDHRNGIRDDDRWSNLRRATRVQNQGNRIPQSNNRLGLKGVCYEADRKKYKAYIEMNGRSVNLGRFDTAKEAQAAYAAAAEKYFGEFARTE